MPTIRIGAWKPTISFEGSHGDVTITDERDLAAPMYARTLTLVDGARLYLAGWPCFVQAGPIAVERITDEPRAKHAKPWRPLRLARST